MTFRGIAAVAIISISFVSAGVSAQPTIHPRKIVSTGPQGLPVNETAVAAFGADELVAMWIIHGSGPAKDPIDLGYAVSHDGGITWIEDLARFPEPGNCPPETREVDPLVVADMQGPFAGDFLGGGFTYPCPPHAPSPFVARKFAGESFFEPSIALTEPCGIDFTSLACGIDPFQGEDTWCYLTAHSMPAGPFCPNGERLVFHRSTDAGLTWSNQEMVLIAGQEVPGVTAVPAVAADGTLYIAYNLNPNGTHIRVVASMDAGVNFFSLGLNEPRIGTGTNLTQFAASEFQVTPIIGMALSQDVPPAIYIVYHDLAEPAPGDGDLDVFLIRGTSLDGVNWSWTPRIRINNDAPNVKHDQFMPAVTVDDLGRVHVIWYDTRLDPQPNTATDVKIGLFYGRSLDGGQTFQNFLVDDQTIDTRHLVGREFIGDYQAITMAGNTAVAVYMGTRHLRFTGPGGFQQQSSFETNETIFSNLIDQEF